MTSFKAIAAMSENRVIGRGLEIPWRIPEDFRWFKQQTQGKIVVMGRKTFESLQKPLPNRINVVLSRNPKLLRDNQDVPPIYQNAKHTSAAMAVLRKQSSDQLSFPAAAPTDLLLLSGFEVLAEQDFQAEMWIVGGASIYEQTLPHCSDLYLTLVKRTVDGDVFFPPFEDQFELAAELRDTPEFKILHYRKRVRP